MYIYMYICPVSNVPVSSDEKGQKRSFPPFRLYSRAPFFFFESARTKKQKAPFCPRGLFLPCCTYD